MQVEFKFFMLLVIAPLLLIPFFKEAYKTKSFITAVKKHPIVVPAIVAILLVGWAYFRTLN